MFGEQEQALQRSYSTAVVCVSFLRHVQIMDKPEKTTVDNSKQSHSNGFF